MHIKIISGGQTGVDRGALDAALDLEGRVVVGVPRIEWQKMEEFQTSIL
jgi:predicted Rossmann fold nucleotide-binding protein DprA/Smf involved in DNA uptake